jgi:hypothetical protein
LRNENAPRAKRIENHLGKHTFNKITRVDVVGETLRVGPT